MRAHTVTMTSYKETEHRPEWSKIKEAARRIGIAESRFYHLLGESNGAVKTLVLKSPEAKRGARLVNIPSLLTYLEKMADTQQTTK